MKLTGKIFITGIIEAETGMHIGGSKSSLDIGGIDLNVIKTPSGVPFIPGSSLKGKLRSLLAKEEGSPNVGEESNLIVEIFGKAQGRHGQAARLIVRDAMLDKERFTSVFANTMIIQGFTESKVENTINRQTGTAKDPRELERVPAGAQFRFEMVLNEFNDDQTQKHLETIRKAMRLLEDDYLGGQGSRGYGQITFKDVNFIRKGIEDYERENKGSEYPHIRWED